MSDWVITVTVYESVIRDDMNFLWRQAALAQPYR